MIIGLLLCIFRAVQPVKSRWLVPIVFVILAFLLNIVYLVLHVWFSFYGTSRTIDILFPLQSLFTALMIIICSTMYMIQTVRYFLVARNLSSLQNVYAEHITTATGDSIPIRTRFLARLYEFLISHLFMIALPIFHLMTSGLIITLITILFLVGIIPISIASTTVSGVGYAIGIVNGTIIVLVCLYDMITHRMLLCKKCLWCEYYRQDNLLFRYEMIFNIILVVCSLIDVGVFSFFDYDAILILKVLNSEVIWIMLFISVGGAFTIISVIWNKLLLRRTLVLNTKNDSLLVQCLNDEVVSRKIEEFCKYEFSIENYKCWKMVAELIKQIQSSTAAASSVSTPSPSSDTTTSTATPLLDSAILQQINILYQIFLSQNSIMEVNIKTEIREKVEEALLSKQTDEIQSALMALEETILCNLMDTFKRFKYTATGKNCIHKMTVKQQELQKLGMNAQ